MFYRGIVPGIFALVGNVGFVLRLTLTKDGRYKVAALRVLLVEDEGLIRLMTSEILSDEGFEVVEAWNGDEAAKILDGPNCFDVLFTDVQMPGILDGIDVAVHARRRDPALPVLVVSGYVGQLTSRLGVLAPPPVFISKPYSLDEIVNVLKRLTGRL